MWTLREAIPWTSHGPRPSSGVARTRYPEMRDLVPALEAVRSWRTRGPGRPDLGAEGRKAQLGHRCRGAQGAVFRELLSECGGGIWISRSALERFTKSTNSEDKPETKGTGYLQDGYDRGSKVRREGPFPEYVLLCSSGPQNHCNAPHPSPLPQI